MLSLSILAQCDRCHESKHPQIPINPYTGPDWGNVLPDEWRTNMWGVFCEPCVAARQVTIQDADTAARLRELHAAIPPFGDGEDHDAWHAEHVAPFWLAANAVLTGPEHYEPQWKFDADTCTFTDTRIAEPEAA